MPTPFSARPSRHVLSGARLTCLIGLVCFLLSALAAFADVTRFPPPGTPTNFTAMAGGSIALTWTASNYAASYSLYRATASGTEGTTPYKSGLTGTSYTDAGVSGGMTYFYTLRAVNADDVSSQPTAEVSATPSSSAPPAPSSLAAAATGANKITLYWNGVSGASGYNVSRSTTSGGPYTLIASGAATADPGPGMTNAFMYSDTAGLVTGTEYFYVVTAVQSGTEGPQSNEASAIPQAGAVPWDTGDPVQILNAETIQLNAVLPQNTDPDTGDVAPAEVGLLTVQGPNGVMYESADTEGDPVTSYGSPGTFDNTNNQIVLNDGSTIPVPGPDDTPSLGVMNAVVPTYLGPQPSALPNDFVQHVNWQFLPPAQGIQRQVLSFRGYDALADTDLIFPSPSTAPGNIGLGLSNKSGQPAKSDSADIYTGGLLRSANKTDPQFFGTELDAGLTLASSNVAKDPAWQPVTFNYFDRKGIATPGRPKVVQINKGGGLPPEIVNGFEVVLLYGDYNTPLKINFVTGGINPAYLQGQVALNFHGQYQKAARRPYPDRSIVSSGNKLKGSITLVSSQPQWIWRNRNSMIIKRVNSIAQNIVAGVPQAQNGSFMYGGSWGGRGDIDHEGRLFKAGQGYVDWDQIATWLEGGYPLGPNGPGINGNGNLFYVTHVPYQFEDHINLSTSQDSLLGAR